MSTSPDQRRFRRIWASIALLTAVVAPILLVPDRATAGAWAQEDRGLYLKLSGARSLATEQFKEDGNTFQLLSEDEEGRYDSWGAFLYGEFGLMPRLTAMTSLQFTSGIIDSDLVRIQTTGIGDFRFGMKYQFLDRPVTVSTSAWLTAPTGYTPDPAAIKAPTLGLGVFAGELNLSVGKSFYPAPVYVSGTGGFRMRGSRQSRAGSRVDYPPEIPWNVEVGVGPADWMWLRGVAQGVFGLGSPQALDTFSLTPLTQSYLKVGPSVIVTLADHYQVSLDYLYTAWGINAVQSHDIMVGFAVDFTL